MMENLNWTCLAERGLYPIQEVAKDEGLHLTSPPLFKEEEWKAESSEHGGRNSLRPQNMEVLW